MKHTQAHAHTLAELYQAWHWLQPLGRTSSQPFLTDNFCHLLSCSIWLAGLGMQNPTMAADCLFAALEEATENHADDLVSCAEFMKWKHQAQHCVRTEQQRRQIFLWSWQSGTERWGIGWRWHVSWELGSQLYLGDSMAPKCACFSFRMLVNAGTARSHWILRAPAMGVAIPLMLHMRCLARRVA